MSLKQLPIKTDHISAGQDTHEEQQRIMGRRAALWPDLEEAPKPAMSNEELARLAATHRRAAEVYERQLEANKKASEPEELQGVKEELAAAKRLIAELEDNIRCALRALEGRWPDDE